MPDKQPPDFFDPENFIGTVFKGDKLDVNGSISFTAAYKAIEQHGNERYEVPEDDPALRLSMRERQRRAILMGQDPIYLERSEGIVAATQAPFPPSEAQMKELWMGVWDRMHDYMAAKDPKALLAQAKRKAANKGQAPK